ncbi:MAG: hypothetical protein P1V35_09090 [Planctomycetota bacterium]|nr:hypothetical protein [Planctomycetota bacterium]
MLSKAAPVALLCALLACGDSNLENPGHYEPGSPSVAAKTPTETPAEQGPMKALQAKSHVLYTGTPDDPHSLQITLADRGFARLKLASEPQVQGRRVLQHLCDGELYVTAPRASKSEILEGPASQTSRNWFDLRSAIYNWGGDPVWNVDPSNPSRRVFSGPDGPSILVELDPDTNLPMTIECVISEGAPRQRLIQMTWSQGSGPAQITGFQVESGNNVLWTESKIQIRRGLTMRADFFRPTDRRQDSDVPVTTHPAPE